MTTTSTPSAIWRCGSSANRRGAAIVVVPGPATCERQLVALIDLLPTDAAVAVLRPPLPDGCGAAMTYVETWLDRDGGDAEELWLVGVGRGGDIVNTLVERTPERYAGSIEIPDRPLTITEQRDLVIWFAGRFARDLSTHQDTRM